MARGRRIGRLALLGTLGALTVTITAGSRVQSISPGLYAGLSWRCVGPFEGGPVASVAGVAGAPGVYTITTSSGGVWKTIDGGDMWASIDRQSITADSPDPHRWIDSANPRRIVRTDAQ